MLLTSIPLCTPGASVVNARYRPSAENAGDWADTGAPAVFRDTISDRTGPPALRSTMRTTLVRKPGTNAVNPTRPPSPEIAASKTRPLLSAAPLLIGLPASSKSSRVTVFSATS